MKFTPSESTQFQPINDDPNAQTFLAKSVPASQPVEFTVSGTGAMPREAQAGETGPAQGASAGGAEQPASPEAGSAAAASDTRPGGGLGNPIDTPDPLTKYRWWILGSLSLVLAAAAAFFLRSPTPVATDGAIPFAAGNLAAAGSVASASQGFSTAATSGSALLSALKEELFAVETERLQGKLTEDDYAQLKGALETVLRRALLRQKP